MAFFDWLLAKKRKNLEAEVKESFSHVKKDISKIGNWISHFHDKHKKHDENIQAVLKRIENLERDVSEMRNLTDFFISGSQISPFSRPLNRLSKQPQTAVQTGGVQTAVQTPVQTGKQTGPLRNLTVMERAVLLVLLNSKEKLSYEDISAVTGKDKSTVRGQINNIKQETEELINEMLEERGKKRFYIEEKVKERILDAIIISRKRPRSSLMIEERAEKGRRKRQK